jgi:uncharacterized protein
MAGERFDHDGEDGRSPAANPTFGAVVARRFNRRDLLGGTLAATAISATLGRQALAAGTATGRFDFTEIEAGVDARLHVADGYDAEVVMAWGDPVLPGAPGFDPLAQSADRQSRQFGYNSDFVGYIPIDHSSEHGLLVVNHEYTNEELMFPGLGQQDGKAGFSGMTAELVGIEMAAHGGSVIEVRRVDGRWRAVEDSRYARRLTAGTPFEVTGPAAGHPRLRTAADPEGRRVLGTINNCSGGVTPWGTWLSGEENFHYYFKNRLPEGHPETANAKRYGVPTPQYDWGRFHARFDLAEEGNEPNRFGWVVEIDPLDPASTPKKRTALGRMKHEGAAGIVNRDGRYVVYLGDDERFEYVYRFVSEGRVDPADRAANRDLLDRGTLSVARYDADGTGRWLPLVHGTGGLDAGAGFPDQATVLIETRRAADRLGATRMDRPEDVEADPRTNRVYVMLTNNTRRRPNDTDAANPRAANAFGHVVEMLPDGGDHAAESFRWEVLVRCGDPSIASVGATFSSETTRNGWFGMPDNCAVDGQGRLWITTDGNNARATGRADGVWAMETDGPLRGTSKHFLRVPAGAEMCGPCFTPDDTTLFLAVQHPGEAADENGPAASYENPATRWPDFRPDRPPRPAVIAVTRRGGGRIA